MCPQPRSRRICRGHDSLSRDLKLEDSGLAWSFHSVVALTREKKMGRDSGELQETPFELVFLDYTGSVQNYGADLR